MVEKMDGHGYLVTGGGLGSIWPAGGISSGIGDVISTNSVEKKCEQKSKGRVQGNGFGLEF